MTQPVGFYSGIHLHKDDPDAPVLSSWPALPNPDPPEDLEAADGEPALSRHDPRVAERSTVADGDSLSAARVQSAAASAPASGSALTEAERRIQARLDVFHTSAMALYHTAAGDAEVTIPFRLGSRPVPRENERAVRDAARRLGMTQADAARVLYGRGTPDEIHQIAQVILARLPSVPPGKPGDTLTDRIRRVMDSHGLGLDCAGYVAQAFLASRGTTRAGSPLRGVSAVDDNLGHLDHRGFVRVPVADARAGDIIRLGPPAANQPGHCMIIVAAHPATAKELAFLLDEAKAKRERAVAANDQDGIVRASITDFTVKQYAESSSLYALVVDSSWGADRDPKVGGVERRLWLYRPETGTWVWPDRFGALDETPEPYAHPLEGVYRPTNER